MNSTSTPQPPVNPPKPMFPGLMTAREPKSKAEMKWRKRPAKALKGWYAVHYSWDEQEGSFVGYTDFSRGEWGKPLPIEVAGPFSSKQKAVEWAERHDPTW